MTRAEAAKHHIENPEAFEHSDTAARGVLIFMAFLLGSLLLSLLVVWGIFGAFSWMQTSEQPFPAPKVGERPPEPRIQVRPVQELRAFRAYEDAILNGYGWVDRTAGVVRIPISRAMDIVAQRGLPFYSGTGAVPTVPATGPQSGGPQTGAPQERGQPAQPWAAKETSEPLRGEQPGLSAPGK
jgi:hypothetical protein